MRYYWNAILLTGGLCFTCCAYTQDASTYPAKVVRVIVALAPGGAVDIQARMFAQGMSENLRQSFIVENRPSARGADAFGLVAKAAPDGYTLLAVNPSFTLPSTFAQNLPDPVKDFAPISLMTRAAYLLVVHPAVPARSIRELIAIAKASPGKLNFSAGPLGTITHLGTLWFLSLAKMNAAYIPYKSAGQSSIAVLGGEVDALIVNVVAAAPYARTGRLRVLGVTSAQRSKLLPDVPTITEQGIPGYDFTTFFGWVAPSGTPAPIVNKLSAELARITHSGAIGEKLKDDGAEPVGSSPAQFKEVIAAEVPRWSKVIKDNGIKIE